MDHFDKCSIGERLFGQEGLYYKGKDVESLSKAELILALKHLYYLYNKANEDHAETLSFYKDLIKRR